MQQSPTTTAPKGTSYTKLAYQTNRRTSNPIAIAAFSNASCSNDRSSSTSNSHDGQDTIGVGFTAKSLPPPRAPYLSSRGFTRDRVSKIPQMELPESAAPSPPSEGTSYGSLRDSLFCHPDNRTGSIYTNTRNFCPQSLPSHIGSAREWLTIGEWATDKSSNKDSIRRNRMDSITQEDDQIINQNSHIDGIEEVLSTSLSTALHIMETSRNDTTSNLSISFNQNERDKIKQSLDNKPFSIVQAVESTDEEFLTTENKSSFEDGGTMTSNEEGHNNNPDTFEAFDLEF